MRSANSLFGRQLNLKPATSKGFFILTIARLKLDLAYLGAIIFLLQIYQIIFKFVV